ncbi:hypothetical protein VaNZ11_014684, partial [Volvox africanus]
MQLDRLGELVCAVVAVIVYLNSIPANFAFDDSFAVIYNGDVTSDSNPLWGLLVNDFWGQPISSAQSHKSWRPLTVLSFRLLRKAWTALPEPWRREVMARRSRTRLPYEEDEAARRGLDPLLFHISNVIWHALVSAMVCRLTYFLLLRRWRPGPLLVCSRRGLSRRRPWRHLERGMQQQRGAEQQQQQTHGSEPQFKSRVPYTGNEVSEAASDRAANAHEAASSGTGIRRRRRSAVPAAAAAAPSRSSGVASNRGNRKAVMTTTAAMEAARLFPQLHFPAWFSGLAFAVHPVHTEAVAGVVGHAELLCAALSLPAVMSYIHAAEAAAAARVAERWTRGAVAAHWVKIAVAAALALAAALAKEIGITVLGCMIAADVLLIPAVVTEWDDDHRTMRSDIRGGKGIAEAMAAAAPPHLSPSLLRRFLRLLFWAVVEEPKGMRMAAVAAVGLCYVRLRSWVAVDQLVRIHRKVENPIAFSTSPLERLLSTGHLHARYAGLLLLPIHLSADWSFDCVPMISRLTDPRNALTAALYSYLTVMLMAARPWGVVATWCRAAAAAAAAAVTGQERTQGKKRVEAAGGKPFAVAAGPAADVSGLLIRRRRGSKPGGDDITTSSGAAVSDNCANIDAATESAVPGAPPLRRLAAAVAAAAAVGGGVAEQLERQRPLKEVLG